MLGKAMKVVVNIVFLQTLLICYLPEEILAIPGSQSDCQIKMTSCIAKEGTKRPVCGDDNQTYSSKCHILKMQCDGQTIALKHKGSCSDKMNDRQACTASRRYALALGLPAGRATGFVPRCRADGHYAAVQCKTEAGCWCVTPQGRPVPNTTVRNGRPRCYSELEKANTRRRSSARGRRNKKGCSRADRSLFSSNLLNIFRSEYERSRGTGNDSAVLDWKFSTVDSDQNDFLDRLEYRQLRRLLKKAVTPRRCARTFGRICDSDRDNAITRREWSTCLTRGELTYEGVAQAPGAANHNNEDNEDNEKDDDDDDNSGPIGVLQGSLTRVSAHLHGLDDPADRSKDENDSNDCLSDRKSVLDEQKSGDTVLYVPECTADGRYQRVQCYRSTGYCWCVNQDSGKPIPGTSIKDQHPRCETLPTPNRPMKGCPDQRKAAFISNLMEFLKQEMVTGTNGTGISGSPDNLKWHASKEEQIATWSFVILDKNKNKVLERKEWKSFRILVTGNRQLSRCGKKLPRYCDINHDRKISITEWLNCLEAQQRSPSPITDTSSKAPTISKRKGPNPLESYLKGD